MDRYEAKSNQLISLMSQLSDSRAKAALQKNMPRFDKYR